MMKKIIFLFATSIMLVACSSTPSTQYYQLPDSAFRLPEQNRAIQGVRLVLAEPLQSNSLLYQTDEYTLNFAQHNLWASPLKEALNNALCNKLNQFGQTTYAPANHTGTTHLTIYIDRFQGNYRGETEISGYAQWQNGQSKPFHVITEQHGDGYAAMLNSLNQGLNKVAQKIVY